MLIYSKNITAEKHFLYWPILSKYIETGWDFHKSFQRNNELKFVTEPCIYQEIENNKNEEKRVNSLLSALSCS